MTFSRTVLVGTLLWTGAITFLHLTLNGDLFRPSAVQAEGRPKFHVGFLPVT